MTDDSDAGTPDAHGRVDAGAPDAGSDEMDAGVDAGVDAGPQHGSVPDAWGTPVPLVELNGPAADGSPTMTGDMLRICFYSTRTGGKGGDGDIWCAFRDTVDAPFGPPVNQGNVNTGGREWLPGLSDDGSELFFSSDRAATSIMNLYRATWIPEAGTYGNVTPVSELNVSKTVWTAGPGLSKSGLTLFFESWRDDGYGGPDIYVATRDTVFSPFHEGIIVPSLCSGNLDGSPSLSPDSSVIVINSERPGGTPSRTLWRAAAKPSGGWTSPVPVVMDDLASFSSLGGARILPDGSLLFSGEKSGGKADIYIAPPKWE